VLVQLNQAEVYQRWHRIEVGRLHSEDHRNSGDVSCRKSNHDFSFFYFRESVCFQHYVCKSAIALCFDDKVQTLLLAIEVLEVCLNLLISQVKLLDEYLFAVPIVDDKRMSQFFTGLDVGVENRL
jgi:hypothetical protein